MRQLTDTNVDLSGRDLSSNRVHGLETRAALPVEGANGDGLRDTGSEGSHTSGKGSSTRRENISNGNVFNESRVDSSLLPYGAQNGRKVFLRSGVLKTSFHALCDRRANSRDDDDVIVVLAQNLSFSTLGEEIGGNVRERHGGDGGRQKDGDE